MEQIKRAWQLFKNQFRIWRGYGVVSYWQEGNTLYISVQRFGLFKTYVGPRYVCDIDIDPTQVIQSPK